MKIYLDSSNVEEIKQAAETKLIDGVTTNPSLIAKENRDFKTTIKEIIQILNKELKDYTLSVEVTDTKDEKSMIKQVKELTKLGKNVIIKIPLTPEGLKATKALSDQKIRCNVTLCFSANQALLAAKAGAWCVSPFIGRLKDAGIDGEYLIEEIKTIYNNYDFKTNILAASIRSPYEVLSAAKMGSDIVTIPYSVFQKLYISPHTTQGLKQFEADWQKYQLNQNK